MGLVGGRSLVSGKENKEFKKKRIGNGKGGVHKGYRAFLLSANRG